MSQNKNSSQDSQFRQQNKQYNIFKRDFQIIMNNVLIEYLLNLKFRVDDSS